MAFLQSPTVLIGRHEVLRGTGLKKSTMYVLIRKGLFKTQVQNTQGTVAWVEGEVEACVRERQALRPRPTAQKGADAPTNRPTARPAGPVSSVLTWPDGGPDRQLQSLNAEQLNQLFGRGHARLKVVEPEYFFDSASGTLWLRVLKV